MRDQKAGSAISELLFVTPDFRAGFEAMGVPQSGPETDPKTYRAIKTALSEIGEAIKELPPAIFEAHPGIDWRGFAAMRDVISAPVFSMQSTGFATLEDEVT